MAMVRRLAQSVVLTLVVTALASCTRHSQTSPKASRTSATVPSVRNASPVQAQRSLRDAGLVLVGFREQKDAAVPKGAVITSDPPPGKRVAAGASVVLIVSTGTPPKPVRQSAKRPAEKTSERLADRADRTALRIHDARISRDAQSPEVRQTPEPTPPAQKRSRPEVIPAAAQPEETPVETAVRPKPARIRFSCNKCGMEFGTLRELDDHSEIHVFRCGVCGAAFSHVSDLRAHARASHFRAALKCPECGAVFYTEAGLRLHVISKHQTDR